MCGIFCSFLLKKYKNSPQHTNIIQACEDLIKLRGPDYLGKHQIGTNPEYDLYFAASVLWMQGQVFSKQPLVDNEGNVLLWNGDIFNKNEILNDADLTENYSKKSSDSEILLDLLKSSEESSDILETISSIKGPFAFIYYQKESNNLWFGRDRLGRHSLLWNFSQNESFYLTSVSKKEYPFLEVPAIGIYSLNLNKGFTDINAYLWDDLSKDFIHQHVQENKYNIIINNSKLISPINYNSLDLDRDPDGNEQVILNIFKDFENLTNEDLYSLLLNNSDIVARVDKLIQLLSNSVKRRIEHQPGDCQNCIANRIYSDIPKEKCTHSKIGVLFSGGIDSAILAILVHHCLPINESIDLLNCAFEKNKKQSGNLKKESHSNKSFNVPDRLTGLSTYKALRLMFPERKFHFVEINIDLSELNLLRDTFIHNLIYPLNTILDESLGCALWFASRGSGIINKEEDNPISYTTPARILLAGMGADEQLGGYYRHRVYLKSYGWSAMGKQVYQDLQKISSRNMGRDDRIVSSHGRQARFPFLDEEVVSFLGSLPIWQRCMPVEQLKPGIGDKLLLRLVAFKLGLNQTAFEPKRAFQFGSRIANSKDRGDDISPRLANSIHLQSSNNEVCSFHNNLSSTPKNCKKLEENNIEENIFKNREEDSRPTIQNKLMNNEFHQSFSELGLSKISNN